MTDDDIRQRLWVLNSKIDGAIGEAANRIVINKGMSIAVDLALMTERIKREVLEAVEEISRARGVKK